ncbi:MAG: cation-transporting P-type ATPase [Mobilitalea sp.]
MIKVDHTSSGILFHTLDTNTALEQLSTDHAGLTEAKVLKHRQIYGNNILEQGKKGKKRRQRLHCNRVEKL